MDNDDQLPNQGDAPEGDQPKGDDSGLQPMRSHSVDPAWLRHLSRILAEHQQQLLHKAMQAFREVQQADVQRIIDAIPKQRIDLSGLQLPATGLTEELFRQLPKVEFPALRRAFRDIARLAQQHMPRNWRAAERRTDLLDVMEMTNWSLIWVPSAPVLDALAKTADIDEAEEVLLAFSDQVCIDMRQVLDEVSDEDLIPVRDGLLQGVTCIEQGLHYPAQATAAVLLTAMLERYFMASSGKNMTQLAEEWAELSPGEGSLRQLRWSAILWSAALALEGYRMQRGAEPVNLFGTTISIDL